MYERSENTAVGIMCIGKGAKKRSRMAKEQENLLVLWRQFHGNQVVGEIEAIADAFASYPCDHPAFQMHILMGR